MSKLQVDDIVSKSDNGAPGFSKGAVVTGVMTATSFSGAATGLTGNFAGNAAGLSGTPDINVKGVNSTGIATAVMFSGNVTGVAATFSGNMQVGGVLTYEDVANIDSLGIVTARTGIKVLAGGANIVGVTTAASGLNVTAGGVNVVGGGITATGIGTFHEGLHLENLLVEEVNVTAGKLSDNLNIDVENGMVHLFTTAESTTSTPNIRYNGSVALNTKMSIGQSIVVTLITTANASAYSANMTIDGGAQTERWVGGSAPSDGGSAGVDIHTFTIIKTADATFTVIGNHSKTS